MKTKIIVHVIDSLSLGGAETLLKNTIALLPEFSHTIVCLETQKNTTKVIINNADIVSLNHRGWKSLPATVIKLRNIINKQKPLLVHSHLFYATFCARLATPSGVPLASTIHSLYSKDAFGKNKKSIWAERFLLKERHALIAVSKFVLDDYLSYVPFRGKRFVLHNFLPDDSFQLKLKPASLDGLKCIAVGNLKEAKNYNYLLEIFSNLKHTGISLDIYGEGAIKNQLQKTIDDNNLPVRLLGNTSNVKDLFKNYHLFVQASSHEGFGISVIEAMAAKLPVLISDIAVFREISSGHAHFFPLDSHLTAADIFMQHLNNPVERIKYVEDAFEFCRQYYSTKVYKEKLLSIYNLCLNASN